MTVSTFRKLRPEEKALLERLLAEPFPGRDELRDQIEHSMVRTIDQDGSIEFTSSSQAAAPVRARVPVEAHYSDADGLPVEILLHVVDGKVSELEIWKGDGTPPIRRLPDTEDLKVERADAAP